MGYKDIKVFAEGYPGWIKAGQLGSYGPKQVKKLVDAGKITLIDARPGRKFKAGNVPGSINISDSRFDKEIDKLPADKTATLVFYCGGVKCPLSPEIRRQGQGDRLHERHAVPGRLPGLGRSIRKVRTGSPTTRPCPLRRPRPT